MRTSRWSFTRSTAHSSTTAALACCPGRTAPSPATSIADADAAEGTRAFERFLSLWNHHLETNGADRLVVLPSADHDFSRLACGSRTAEQLPAAFTFLLTWGSIPSIYYGDEIGMRYLEGAPEKEGSIWTPKYNRAGCRTPMQWDSSLPNAGFSTAPPQDLYLPQDPDAGPAYRRGAKGRSGVAPALCPEPGSTP